MATPSAHTEVPGGHKAAFPPFAKETFASQVFWLVLSFVLLYWVVSRLALPRVSSILEARRSRIAADFAEATRLKEATDAALADYEKSLAAARARAQAIAAETRERLNAEAEKSRKALEEQLNAKLAEADRAIATARTAAMANVRSIAIDAAGAIVTQLIGITPPEPATAQAVDDVLKG
jgi:F-type H+-transporting ATPase subunit b